MPKNDAGRVGRMERMEWRERMERMERMERRMKRIDETSYRHHAKCDNIYNMFSTFLRLFTKPCFVLVGLVMFYGS